MMTMAMSTTTIRTTTGILMLTVMRIETKRIRQITNTITITSIGLSK